MRLYIPLQFLCLFCFFPPSKLKLASIDTMWLTVCTWANNTGTFYWKYGFDAPLMLSQLLWSSWHTRFEEWQTRGLIQLPKHRLLFVETLPSCNMAAGATGLLWKKAPQQGKEAAHQRWGVPPLPNRIAIMAQEAHSWWWDMHWELPSGRMFVTHLLSEHPWAFLSALFLRSWNSERKCWGEKEESDIVTSLFNISSK